MTLTDYIVHILEYGIILESAKGKVPNLVDKIEGETIAGLHKNQNGDLISVLIK